jgi:hypothetical protein
MAQHTPGPWKVRSSGSIGTDDVFVAEAFGHEAQEANKRLIVAAPEMLELLKLYIDDHNLDWQIKRDCFCKLCVKAREIIAKIESK